MPDGKQTRSKVPALPAAQPEVQKDQEERHPPHLNGEEEDISFEEELHDQFLDLMRTGMTMC